jgi:uncharacterized integral membrane protein
MTSSRLPASAGLKWILDGLRQTAQNPRLLLWVALTLVLFRTILYFNGVLSGVLGDHLDLIYAIIQFFFISAISFLTLHVNLISIYRGVARGEKSSFKLFFAPIKGRASTLLRLSGFFCLALLSIMAITIIIRESHEALYPNYLGERSSHDFLSFQKFWDPATQIILYYIFAMAFSFSPLLIAFRQYNANAAIRHSFSVCLKNWRPISVNAIALFAVCYILYIFPLRIIIQHFPLFGSGMIYSFSEMALAFTPACILYASLYQIYNTLFSGFRDKLYATARNAAHSNMESTGTSSALILIFIFILTILFTEGNTELLAILFYAWPITLPIILLIFLTLIITTVCRLANAPRGTALWIFLALFVLAAFPIFRLFRIL